MLTISAIIPGKNNPQTCPTDKLKKISKNMPRYKEKYSENFFKYLIFIKLTPLINLLNNYIKTKHLIQIRLPKVDY